VNGTGIRVSQVFDAPGMFCLVLQSTSATNFSTFDIDLNAFVSCAIFFDCLIRSRALTTLVATETKPTKSMMFYYGLIIVCLLPLLVICIYRIYKTRQNYYKKLAGKELNLDPSQVSGQVVPTCPIAL